MTIPVAQPTTVGGSFVEWDALQPGPVFANVSALLYVYPDAQGLAVLVFEHGERVPLSVTYDVVKTAIAAVP